MNHFENLQRLCEIIDLQNEIIQRQAEALEQMGAICMEEEIEKATSMKSVITMGGAKLLVFYNYLQAGAGWFWRL